MTGQYARRARPRGRRREVHASRAADRARCCWCCRRSSAAVAERPAPADGRHSRFGEHAARLRSTAEWAHARPYRSNDKRLAALPEWLEFYCHVRPHTGAQRTDAAPPGACQQRRRESQLVGGDGVPPRFLTPFRPCSKYMSSSLLEVCGGKDQMASPSLWTTQG